MREIKMPLIIINKAQFGYHTDYTKYCEYLHNEYKITYICFDTGFEKLEMDNVIVKYVPWKGPKAIRGLRFLFTCVLNIVLKNSIIFVDYFEKAHLLKKMFPKKKMILNVRTLSVSQNESLRAIQDKSLSKACAQFDHITPISKGVEKKLNLSSEKSTIVPLGADMISTNTKTFDNLRLLYVGTLNGRNIDHTIIGLSSFIQKHPEIPISYDIIGDGKEIVQLEKLISDLKLDSLIKLHGRIPHFKLQPFFDNSNVGISYIPMTEYYDFQPPTKTFEYIMSGMPCISTNTSENRNLIIQNNGVLCDDNPESFAKALKKVFENNRFYESEIIRDSLNEYTWKNIVENTLKPLLNKFN